MIYKMEATTQYFGQWFSINRSEVFMALPKFYATHLGVKITGPFWTYSRFLKI
jgi:hypothetical protein